MNKGARILELALIMTLSLSLIVGTAVVLAATGATEEAYLETSTEAALQESDEITIEENEPLRIYLAPQDGYVLPAELTLIIGEHEYTIYSDGLSEPEGIAFNPESGILSIAAELVQDGDTIALVAAAQQEIEADSTAAQESAEEDELPSAVEAEEVPGATDSIISLLDKSLRDVQADNNESETMETFAVADSLALLVDESGSEEKTDYTDMELTQ